MTILPGKFIESLASGFEAINWRRAALHCFLGAFGGKWQNIASLFSFFIKSFSF
jgi:hypothetical protein